MQISKWINLFNPENLNNEDLVRPGYIKHHSKSLNSSQESINFSLRKTQILNKLKSSLKINPRVMKETDHPLSSDENQEQLKSFDEQKESINESSTIDARFNRLSSRYSARRMTTAFLNQTKNRSTNKRYVKHVNLSLERKGRK